MIGALIGPAWLRALFFDAVVGERKPTAGSLTYHHVHSATGHPAARIDAPTLAGLGGHLSLDDQRALWTWRLSGRVQRAATPMVSSRRSTAVSIAVSSAPLVALNDADLLCAWIDTATASDARLIVIDVPGVFESVAMSILPTVSDFCAFRSRSVLLGFDKKEQVPSRIHWRWHLHADEQFP